MSHKTDRSPRARRVHPRAAMRAPLLGALMSTTLLATAQPRGAEDVFRDAASFTVEVRTRITSAFDEDTEGVRHGAGFVIDAERGWILTNAHVAARSPSTVQVAYRGERFVRVAKRYVDPLIDLAVLELDPRDRKPSAAEVSCDAPPEIGHPVGAFGHPWGQRFTATRGIVSRHAMLGRGAMLQTDAAINGGNSGGPLISLVTGRVVGINTAQLRGSQNLSFALPTPYACRIVAMLRAGRDPSPPRLPVQFYEDPDEAGELRIARVDDDAAVALRAGDLVLGPTGGPKVRDRVALLDALRGRTTVSLDVLRGGTAQRVDLTVRAEAGPLSRKGLRLGGMLVAPNEDATELIVHSVAPGSEADAKGVQYFDSIDLADGRPVRGLDDLRERIGTATRTVEFSMRRPAKGSTRSTFFLRTLQIESTQWVTGADGG